MPGTNFSLQVRNFYLPTSCLLHYKNSPLEIAKGFGQFLYNPDGVEYLDCVNNHSHVGHCHPHISSVASHELGIYFDWPANDWITTPHQDDLVFQKNYVQQLGKYFPPELCVFFLTNSGSEAVDLAVILARSYTQQLDVVVVDGAFHGVYGLGASCSPRQWKLNKFKKEDWAHELPLPNLYRGINRESDAEAEQKYIDESIRIIQRAVASGRKIAAFLTEPVFTLQGIIVPPTTWFSSVARAVREVGGLVIADEVNTGFGRCSENFWGYQIHGIIPDIVVLGKSIGNGYPMGAVVTTKEIARSLPSSLSVNDFEGNRAVCRVASALIDVLQIERLVEKGSLTGTYIMEGLQKLQKKFEVIGEIRGRGMMIGVELVMGQNSRKPNPVVTEKVVLFLKEDEHVILGAGGNFKNVLLLLPPLCFTRSNVDKLMEALDRVLTKTISGDGGETSNESLFSFTESLASSSSSSGSISPECSRYGEMD